jgi:hypothetical protein
MGCNSCKRAKNLKNTIGLVQKEKKDSPEKTFIIYETTLNTFNYCEKEFNKNYKIVKTI